MTKQARMTPKTAEAVELIMHHDLARSDDAALAYLNDMLRMLAEHGEGIEDALVHLRMGAEGRGLWLA